MCFVKILLTILGVVFAFLAVVLTVDALIVLCPEACSPVDIPGDCECDSNVTPYFILNDLIGGWAIIVPIVMYILSFLCFLKALGGRRD